MFDISVLGFCQNCLTTTTTFDYFLIKGALKKKFWRQKKLGFFEKSSKVVVVVRQFWVKPSSEMSNHTIDLLDRCHFLILLFFGIFVIQSLLAKSSRWSAARDHEQTNEESDDSVPTPATHFFVKRTDLLLF